MHPKITIFTPTYNRAYILPRLFESLQRQSSFQFNWLIIDDGSTDNTKDVVVNFKKSAQFEIEYYYKNNGGKHTAINKMLDTITTELVVIVDSDDYLSDHAVEIILKDYEEIVDKAELCAIVYLRSYFDGRIIGDGFPDDEKIVKANSYIINSGIKGDKCEVFFVHALKNFRFPVFEGERFLGETAVWVPLYRRYKTYVRNQSIYSCEYRDDGLSMAGRKLRIKNPNGGMANSLVYIAPDIRLRLVLKHSLLYACYGFFSAKGMGKWFKDFPNKLILTLMILPGWGLYRYWKKKFGEKL